MTVDYGKIIRRSIDLIQKNKWLWVYGLTLALFSGGSGSGGGGSPSSSSSKNIPQNLPKDLPERAEKVMGLTTNLIKEWFSSVPLATWVAIGIGVSIVILLWIILSWIIQSWAKGGLIAGLADADNEKPVTLLSTAPQAIQSVKNLILSGLISLGITLGIIILAIIIIGGGSLVTVLIPPVNIIWLVISIITTVFALIVMFLIFSMLGIYADRLIVLKGYTPWNAWKKGLSMSKGNFIPTVIMAIINSTVGCLGGCLATIVVLIVLGIPSLILLLPLFAKKEFQLPGIPTIGALAVLFFLFATLLNLIKAAFILFNFSNWNLFFKEVWAKEETMQPPPKENGS